MIALITGATSGFGKGTAEIFAKNGYNVIITGRRKERLDQLKRKLEEENKIKVLALCFDIRNQKETEQAINELPPEFRSIDILINNAGLAAGLSPIQEGSIEHWERMIDTNIKGLLYVTKCVSKIMVACGKGHIINVGSVAGKEAYANGNVYCATKHAVDALNKSMRIDLLPYGIKVSAINPGMAETEFSIVRFDGDKERAEKVYEGIQALTAEDIAEAIYWMASRPPHVNINDMIIMPTAQANATTINRKNKN